MIPRRDPLSRRAYVASKVIYRLSGRLPGGYRTPYRVAGRPVILIHNPKAAGSSLRALLGTSGMTHAMPRHVMSAARWDRYFAVAAIRHPFDRFASGYAYHVLSDYRGALYKAHGAALKTLTPVEYLTFVAQHPENLGAQTLWTDHPRATHPRADLVLRFEEIETWPTRLRAAGVDVGERMPSRNAGPHSGQRPGARLGLSPDALAALRGAVHDAYRRDYETFGYDP